VKDVADVIDVIDTDSHLLEPPDLWTKRLGSRWDEADLPHVRRDPATNEDWWFVAGKPEVAVGTSAMAGYHEYFPDRPPTFADVTEIGAYEPHARLKWMDESGIHAQLIYPNVSGFGSGAFAGMRPELALDCVRTYNDFLSEWAEADPRRLIPLAALPLWDVKEAVKEATRATANGHRGLVMSANPDRFGAPMLADPAWYPLWEAAEGLEIPVNFHIGSGGLSTVPPMFDGNGLHANAAKASIHFFMGNSDAITEIIFSGMCHRFPRLNFVSAESGIGWVPYLLEAMDWQWENDGVELEHLDFDMLPSEYFHRQVYACFWFERLVPPRVLDLIGVDNVLFETDYPHPTCMSPGPASIAQRPRDFIEENYSHLPDDVLRKILHDNAARIYGLDRS
jgi:predicted TIM-barrel fold metal-dependent hydrolase